MLPLSYMLQQSCNDVSNIFIHYAMLWIIYGFPNRWLWIIFVILWTHSSDPRVLWQESDAKIVQNMLRNSSRIHSRRCVVPHPCLYHYHIAHIATGSLQVHYLIVNRSQIALERLILGKIATLLQLPQSAEDNRLVEWWCQYQCIAVSETVVLPSKTYCILPLHFMTFCPALCTTVAYYL